MIISKAFATKITLGMCFCQMSLSPLNRKAVNLGRVKLFANLFVKACGNEFF